MLVIFNFNTAFPWLAEFLNPKIGEKEIRETSYFAVVKDRLTIKVFEKVYLFLFDALQLTTLLLRQEPTESEEEELKVKEDKKEIYSDALFRSLFELVGVRDKFPSLLLRWDILFANFYKRSR